MSNDANEVKGAEIVPPQSTEGEQASLALISLVSSGLTVAQARAKLAGKAAPIEVAVTFDAPVIEAVEVVQTGDELVIPQNWRELHHFKIIALAKAADPEMAELIVTKEDAIETLEKLEAEG